jgi:hypothetical protein
MQRLLWALKKFNSVNAIWEIIRTASNFHRGSAVTKVEGPLDIMAAQ